MSKDVPPKPMPTLYERADGSFDVVWPSKWIRFMFDDGRTVDVVTTRDDSDLRQVLLKQFKAETVVGTAQLPSGGLARGDSPTESAAQAATGETSPAAVPAVTRRTRASRPVERPVGPPDSPQQDESEHHE